MSFETLTIISIHQFSLVLNAAGETRSLRLGAIRKGAQASTGYPGSSPEKPLGATPTIVSVLLLIITLSPMTSLEAPSLSCQNPKLITITELGVD